MPPAEDPTLSDLRRELAKAREALAGAEQHLARHAEMNAALHCATNVMYSPLHAKVTTAIAGIDHALQRSQPAVTATAMAPAPQHTDANCPWVALLAELDRCEHTRHQGDVCGSCDGTSRGNPHMQPGDVIGYSLRHGEIVMPDRENKHDISAWRHTPAEDGS